MLFKCVPAKSKRAHALLPPPLPSSSLMIISDYKLQIFSIFLFPIKAAIKKGLLARYLISLFICVNINIRKYKLNGSFVPDRFRRG
jgi:hypothetical protein